MAGNEKEETQHTSSDAFIDPLTGIAAQPMESALDESSSAAPSATEVVDPGLDFIASTPEIHAGTESEITSLEAKSAVEVQEVIDTTLPSSETTIVATPPSLEPSEDSLLAKCKFFSIVLRNIRDEIQIKKVVKILLHLNENNQNATELEHKIRSLGGYKTSYLGEMEAYVLMQKFYQEGIAATLSLTLDTSSPINENNDFLSQEELLQSAPAVQSIGAFPVEIPQHASEILLSTVNTIEGYSMGTNKGVILAHSSIPKIFFRENEKEERLQNKIQEIAKSPAMSSLPKAEIDKVFQSLLQNLQKEAFRRGANGIIGIQLSGFAETQSINPETDQIRLIASGTAVLFIKTSNN